MQRDEAEYGKTWSSESENGNEGSGYAGQTTPPQAPF